MTRDTSTVDGATKVLNVSEDTRDNSGRSIVDDTSSASTTVARTLSYGVSTPVAGTPGLGSAASTSTSSEPGSGNRGTPTSDGQGPADRMAAAGYRGSGWGENIAACYDSAQKVVAAWMNSEGHRQNILNCRFTSIGIGYDPGRVRSDWGPGSWVQDFGRS